MIELLHVNKSFNGIQVLNDINIQFNAGELNYVIGSSGGGKSVLMKCMVGLVKPDSGSILYDGRDFLAKNEDEVRAVRQEIGMLFQGTALFDSLTVEENVGFPLKMLSNMNKSDILDRVNFCLKRVNLDNVNKKYPAEISGGMKKRVGIARAIALQIKYLYCDEPNSGLDPLTSRVIDELLKDITEEFQITTVINSHDMKSVFDTGDKVTFIYKGAVKWHGTRHNIKNELADVPELDAFAKASFLS
ncbi:MAG: ATP-binding cassette domain-containing protein [Bacteroidia bacterium]|nr:ATP-binding cassette domain-containing protein [Bacteroidia bacterium]